MPYFGERDLTGVHRLKNLALGYVKRQQQNDLLREQMDADRKNASGVNAVALAFQQRLRPKKVVEQSPTGERVEKFIHPNKDEVFQNYLDATQQMQRYGERGRGGVQLIDKVAGVWEKLNPEFRPSPERNIQTMDVDVLDKGMPKTIRKDGITYRTKRRRDVSTGADIPNSDFLVKDDDQTYRQSSPRGVDDPNVQRKYIEDINRARNQVGVWDKEIGNATKELEALSRISDEEERNRSTAEKRSEIRELKKKKFEAEALLGGAEDNARNAGISVDFSGISKKGNKTTPRRNREGLSSDVTEPNADYHTDDVQVPFKLPEQPSEVKKLSSEDDEAIAWAKSNRNDPRAKKILKLHNIK